MLELSAVRYTPLALVLGEAFGGLQLPPKVSF